MSASTIIGALFEPGLPSARAEPEGDDRDDAVSPGQLPSARVFKIRGADSAGQRSSANILIRKRYAWRGYGAPSLPPTQLSNRITLTATDRSVTIGTITVGLDGDEKLHAEDTFAPEVEALRAGGRRLCEFTKLAVDTQTSRQVLASLFHVAYLLAHRLRGCDMLVVEVNPRHVAYYRRLLGFTLLAAQRANERVNAPAVLLGLDLNYAREQIARLGGRSGLPSSEQQRTIYPLFFSAAEESGIIARMQRETW